MKISKQKPFLVFSIGDDGCIITCFSGKTLIKRVFAINPLASEFEDIAKNYPTADIYVLLDNIDQSYNLALLPPVSSGYLKKLINRKIASDFDKNDLNSVIRMGREKTARKDHKCLFISVRNAPPVSDWIDAILELPNKFMGAYLLPLESANFISQLREIVKKEDAKIEAPQWEVLVSHNRVGGIRQVVLKDGQFIFTRISQLNLTSTDAESISNSITQEAINTLEYIRRIGYNDDQLLNIYFVCSRDIAQYVTDLSTNSIRVFSYYPYKIATELQFSAVAQESDKYCDVVFAASFANNKKKTTKIVTQKAISINKLYSAIAALFV
jgi:hypothetical protein